MAEVCRQFIGVLAGTDKISQQAVDAAHLATLAKSYESLQGENQHLKDDLMLLDRKIGRMELEARKSRGKVGSEAGLLPNDTTEHTEPSAQTDIEHSVLKAELESLRGVLDGRLEELKQLQADRDHYKLNADLMHARLQRIPEVAEKDPRRFEDIYSELQHLRSEIKSRHAVLEMNERHWAEGNLRRSQLISKLEEDRSLRRLAAKDFADAIEVDSNRLRKDRDHMRELYEAANMQVASLSKQNQHLQVLNENLSKMVAANGARLKEIISGEAGEMEAMFLAEIESIGEAFDALQKQNFLLAKQVGDRDEIITQITSEKLRCEFSLTQAQREADLTKQKALKVEMDSLRAAEEAEAESRRSRQALDQSERTLLERSSETDGLKWQVADLGRQGTELRQTVEGLNARLAEPVIADRLLQLEAALFERRRVEERLQVTSAKLDTYIASSSGALSKDLQEELTIYKKLMKCNSCHTRNKNTVLTKCMHVFCKECIDTRIETRQRKCPNCAESFGVNDVRAIYL